MVIRTDETERIERDVWDALAGVHDPEIPPCSITDLGIVERVSVRANAVEIDLLPTFAGCPALDVIRSDAEAAVRPLADGRDVRVRFVYAPPWTSDRITRAGRAGVRVEVGVGPRRERVEPRVQPRRKGVESRLEPIDTAAERVDLAAQVVEIPEQRRSKKADRGPRHRRHAGEPSSALAACQ